MDATLTTMEGLERLEGHLYNWYDTVSLAPLDPRYVSTVDSGNLAGSLIALSEGLKELPASAAVDSLVARASSFAYAMNFGFLHDRRRKLLSIGYRVADAEGPGELDSSQYDLLASEARLASFLGIAKGDLPELHWFRLGRTVTGVHGVPTLLSWSGTMFEYLMPLLVMRSYPGTLLEESCRSAVRRQRDYGRERGVPWGISESAYDLIDHHDNYQYKAFGVPGLGLKRGLGDDLVVAPYAVALAALVDPAAAVDNLRRLEAAGVQGAFGFFDAVDFTKRGTDDPGVLAPGGRKAQGVVVRAYLAHHQGMTLVALANALQGNRMVDRFHADPRVRATELLLQEKAPRHAPFARPRPDEAATRTAPVPTLALRRFRSAHTPFPHAQFLSNGNYISVVTNAGGGSSFCRGRAVTRSRLDSTVDPGSQFLYLRDVRSGRVWSATQHPVASEAEDYLVTFAMERATFHRREDEIATQLDIAVSPEDDVEVRRLVVTNHSHRAREIEVTSYAEMVLAPAADDLAHPAFGKLFVESEYVPECAALLCHRRPRSPDEAPAWGLHVLGQEGRTQGPVEWEANRARFLGRGRGVRDPQALDGRSLTGYHRRPARSHRQPSPAHPARPRRRGQDVVRHRDVGQPGDGAGARPALPRPRRHGPDLRPRLGERPEHAPAPRDHRRGGAPLRPARLPGPAGRRVAPGGPGAPGPQHPRPGGALAARDLGRRAHRAGPGRRRGRSRAGAAGAPGAGVLEAQGAPGRRRRS